MLTVKLLQTTQKQTLGSEKLEAVGLTWKFDSAACVLLVTLADIFVLSCNSPPPPPQQTAAHIQTTFLSRFELITAIFWNCFVPNYLLSLHAVIGHFFGLIGKKSWGSNVSSRLLERSS